MALSADDIELLNDPAYEALTNVLLGALRQAALGKGRARHANNLPFDRQPMQTESDAIGTDAGLIFQARKKIREGAAFNDFNHFEAEMFGAINYVAGAVIWRRRRVKSEVLSPK